MVFLFLNICSSIDASNKKHGYQVGLAWKQHKNGRFYSALMIVMENWEIPVDFRRKIGRIKN